MEQNVDAEKHTGIRATALLNYKDTGKWKKTQAQEDTKPRISAHLINKPVTWTIDVY
jgi:hypothetical protein